MKTLKLTPKQIQAKIKYNNKKFKKLNKAGKRVAIAKDVIKSLSEKIIKANSGNYISNARWGLEEDDQIQGTILGGETCNVCAMGAILISKARLCNDVKFSDIQSTTKKARKGGLIVYNLKGLFSVKQLRLIEVAFEGSVYEEGCNLSQKNIDKAKLIYDKYYFEDEEINLIAIMKNIIKNNGTFKP